MTSTSEKTLTTTLEIKSWDEQPYREFDDGRKFTRSAVQLGSNDGIESATFEALMFYRPDGTCSDASLMQITANLDGKSGSFVLRGSGEYDGTTANGEYQIVAGEGGLAGISGKLTSASTKQDYPNMPITLTYQL
ncbi:MAG: DUF3224 domain-containing protein [Nakamurella sp.]